MMMYNLNNESVVKHVMFKYKKDKMKDIEKF